MEEISVKNRLELMNVLPSKACEEVFTRADVASKVLELLKEKPGVFSNPNYRFLDIYTKSGVFLLLIYSELMQGLVEAIPDPEIRSQHILGKMIYGVSPSVETALISRKTLYGDWSTQGNIKVITGYKNDTGKRTFSNISKEFNGMKFDVVIGNPPYNNDLYLDFVTLGHQLSTKYTCMITPAKWQTKGSNKNERFRRDIVPYMSKIVFYLDAGDIFDIREMDGITYYLIGHVKHDNKTIVNRCTRNINFNNIVERKLLGTDSLNNIGNTLVTKLSTYKKYKFRNNEHQKYMVSLVDAMNFPGKRIVDTQGKTLMFPPIHIDEIILGNESCVFSSDSKAECESFISWVETKLVKFLVLINTIGYNGLFDDLHFKYVPDPGDFDHIFTDQELYDKYGLTQEEINVIESVIKERKQTEDK